MIMFVFSYKKCYSFLRVPSAIIQGCGTVIASWAANFDVSASCREVKMYLVLVLLSIIMMTKERIIDLQSLLYQYPPCSHPTLVINNNRS